MVDQVFAPLLAPSAGESSKPPKPGAAKKRLRHAVWEGDLVKQVKAVQSELEGKIESQQVGALLLCCCAISAAEPSPSA